MAVYELAHGTTEQLLFNLQNADGTAFNGTGYTLGLRVYDKESAAVSLSGTVEWSNQSGGVAAFTPAAADLDQALSPYTVRWSLTDGGGLVGFAPTDKPDSWVVRY